jgi:hypothetical protein
LIEHKLGHQQVFQSNIPFNASCNKKSLKIPKGDNQNPSIEEEQTTEDKE